jgi:hypothetical protein
MLHCQGRRRDARRPVSGTHRLVQASAQAGAETQQARVWTDAERQARREAAHRLNLRKSLVLVYHGAWWSVEELALLGTLPDVEVAARTGRTVTAVRVKRRRAGLFSVGQRTESLKPITNAPGCAGL